MSKCKESMCASPRSLMYRLRRKHPKLCAMLGHNEFEYRRTFLLERAGVDGREVISRHIRYTHCCTCDGVKKVEIWSKLSKELAKT